MNEVPEEKKESMTKTLAIMGFVAIIILIVWLAVNVVALIPGAFSSLASIADSIYNGQKELVVTTKNSVVKVGQAFTISWNEMPGTGTYEFTYQCADGVALEVRRGSGDIEPINCDTFVALGENTSVDVLVTAEKERFTDVEYTITYRRENVEDIVTDQIITVVNAAIPAGVVAGDSETDNGETETPTPVITFEPEPVEPTPAEPTTPRVPTTGSPATPSNPQPTTPPTRTVTQYIYEVPVSNPNGVVDLAVKHLGVGTIDGGVFVAAPVLHEDRDGAVQFEIKNVGTKTSDEWRYEAELPSDITYRSQLQAPLKPNERAIITLEFEGITRTGLETFGAEVETDEDITTANNSYSWVVEVVD